MDKQTLRKQIREKKRAMTPAQIEEKSRILGDISSPSGLSKSTV